MNEKGRKRGERQKGKRRRESEISMHQHLEIKEFFRGQILLDQQGLYVQGLDDHKVNIVRKQ